MLAPSPTAAIAASPVTVTCVKTHTTTTELLRPVGAALAGKTIIDLSTGGAKEAEELVAMLLAANARWQIGMINAYPSGIGKAETAILCAGPAEVWAGAWRHRTHAWRRLRPCRDRARRHPRPVRRDVHRAQGFMFGLIYGGAVCRKAGLPMEAFAAQVPVTFGMAKNYADLFVRTVPNQGL